MRPRPNPRRFLITLAFVVLLIAAAVPVVSAATITGNIYDPQYEVQEHPTPGNVSTPTSYQDLYYWEIYCTNLTAREWPTQIVIHNALLSQSGEQYASTENYRVYKGNLSADNRNYADVYVEYQKIKYEGSRAYYTVVVNLDWNYVALNSLTGTYKKFGFTGFGDTIFTAIAFEPRGTIPLPITGLQYDQYYGAGHRLPYSERGYVQYLTRLDTFEQSYTVSTDEHGINIDLIRVINGKTNPSKLIVTNLDGSPIYESPTPIDSNGTYHFPNTDVVVSLESLYTTWRYEIYRGVAPTPTPTPTEEPTVLRTGTVTMTDNNGTTITGFDVTAINAYTGENYTVSTETDVAVMTLPMDRTIQIRNPQTGVYEEAPIGYYRFYGQASGYKMLNEGGIQVVVMPEKYSTYKLCDIGVTSESGYLTGKHQFQIRSRSDNSILQTGTVSAKSATTGDWYNTTVSGGIATLILPYDTSNVNSQYAGNYYVYATSPGYQDSDYGTQIVVMPQTVSEIRSILLTPIGGIPPAGNVTLRIQVFSETGPGVVDAEIFIAGVSGEGSSVWDTYTASSTGYLTVPVPGNSTYDIVASGDGYYDSARRIEVFTDDPPLIEIKLYLSGTPTLEPTTQPTGWPTDRPTTQPPGGIPDEDDDSEGFLMQAVRGIGLAFGVGFATAKLIFGMLLALAIGYSTAKQLRGGAAEFGLGLLGGTLLGVLIGLLPVWIIVVLLLVVGLYIGNRYVGGGNNG